MEETRMEAAKIAEDIGTMEVRTKEARIMEAKIMEARIEDTRTNREVSIITTMQETSRRIRGDSKIKTASRRTFKDRKLEMESSAQFMKCQYTNKWNCAETLQKHS
jgi:hypothetical protein